MMCIFGSLIGNQPALTGPSELEMLKVSKMSPKSLGRQSGKSLESLRKVSGEFPESRKVNFRNTNSEGIWVL